MKKLLFVLCAVAALLAPAFLLRTPAPEHARASDPVSSSGTESVASPGGASRPAAPAGATPTGTGSTTAITALSNGLSPVGQSNAPPASALDLEDLAVRLAALDDPKEILPLVDLADEAQRALAVARLSEIEETRLAAVHEQARVQNIPLEIRHADGRIARLHSFRADGTPLYRVATNRNAATSSGASLLVSSPYSLTGSGMKVAVWDEGSVRAAHQELTGRITLRNPSATLSDHSTHVAGTIGASGVQVAAKGMAPAILIDSYDWTNDYTEMTAAGAATATDSRIPLSNHSYGYDAATADMGRYETEARSVDAVANSLPYYLPFWAAGNEQDTLTALGGYQSITFNGLAKNVLSVGAVNDAVASGARSVPAATMSYFSSWGPADDGRIKPDLVANGVGVYSSISTGNAAYASYDGTSMATPSAVGSTALLVQLYAREFSGQRLRASALKALLIHTADDLGADGHPDGPDYRFGWGLINVQRAADLILAHKASLASPKIIEGTLTPAQKTVTHSFTWDGTSPIRATLAWTDPAGVAQTAADSRAANLVHNLDLTVTSPGGTVSRPFVMPFVGTWTRASMVLAATTGKNNVDNVEQVLVSAPSQAGAYVATVTVDGALAAAGQVYSLILTGGADVAANPAPSVALTSPVDGATILAGVGVTLSATATDNAAGGGAGVVSSVEFLVNGTGVGALAAPPYTVSWTPSASGTYALMARATDSEGAVATSATTTLRVLAGDGAPTISGFTPTSGAEGASVAITGQNFADVSSVTFNGAAASYVVDSLTGLHAVVPAGASSGLIGVVTARGTASSATSFTVLQSPVLISQIYGGGGQSGATLSADYVELHNRGVSAVSLAGWSVQYASASGTTWQSVALSGNIAPNGYFLVKLSAGATGSALPAADTTGSLNMSATNGKVALRNTTTAFTGSTPASQNGLQDFVGYGTATAYEGSAAAPSPSTTLAIFRAGGGATDTGKNSDDFAAASPNPRNSSGGTVAPAITSATSAGGIVGTAFSYQITASNAPTSYSAAPLPAGLSFNTVTGLISGTPTAAGTTSVTLGATNSAGSGAATLAITITSSGGGVSALLSEDFASIATGNNTSSNGANTAWAGNANFPTVSSAYQAGGVVKLGTGSLAGSLTSKALDLSGNGGAFTVTFKVKGWTSVEGNIIVTVNGANPKAVTYASVMAGAFESKTLQLTGGAASTTVTFATSLRRAYLDDIQIGVVSAASPVITLSGSPAELTAIYGAASTAPTSFTLSAADLTSAVTVSAPAGFEVSQTAGGASGYAASQSVGSTGTLAATTLYVRLAAGPSAGVYAGDLTATSSGALPRTLSLPAGEIRPKLLTVTAQNRAKAFGEALALGTSAFDASGLVGAETIGSVTLAASGGTVANDAAGAYVITPAQASGGTFTASNYDIGYQPGTLTVAGLDFSGWIGARFTGSAAAATADPDGDGMSNLLEFFLGLDPANSDASGNLVRIELVAGELRHDYRRNKKQSQYRGFVEWTDSLATGQAWSRVGVTDELVADYGDYELRRSHVPLPSGVGRRFLRLAVEPAPTP